MTAMNADWKIRSSCSEVLTGYNASFVKREPLAFLQYVHLKVVIKLVQKEARWHKQWVHTSCSICSWFARGAVGAASPFLHVCSAVGMWCYPTNCVCLALGAFPVMVCVPPADLTHLRQTCWRVVRLPLGTQGYPFIPSVWV